MKKMRRWFFSYPDSLIFFTIFAILSTVTLIVCLKTEEFLVNIVGGGISLMFFVAAIIAGNYLGAYQIVIITNEKIVVRNFKKIAECKISDIARVTITKVFRGSFIQIEEENSTSETTMFPFHKKGLPIRFPHTRARVRMIKRVWNGEVTKQ